jgi:hypothetical protein
MNKKIIWMFLLFVAFIYSNTFRFIVVPNESQDYYIQEQNVIDGLRFGPDSTFKLISTCFFDQDNNIEDQCTFNYTINFTTDNNNYLLIQIPPNTMIEDNALSSSTVNPIQLPNIVSSILEYEPIRLHKKINMDVIASYFFNEETTPRVLRQKFSFKLIDLPPTISLNYNPRAGSFELNYKDIDNAPPEAQVSFLISNSSASCGGVVSGNGIPKELSDCLNQNFSSYISLSTAVNVPSWQSLINFKGKLNCSYGPFNVEIQAPASINNGPSRADFTLCYSTSYSIDYKFYTDERFLNAIAFISSEEPIQTLNYSILLNASDDSTSKICFLNWTSFTPGQLDLVHNCDGLYSHSYIFSEDFKKLNISFSFLLRNICENKKEINIFEKKFRVNGQFIVRPYSTPRYTYLCSVKEPVVSLKLLYLKDYPSCNGKICYVMIKDNSKNGYAVLFLRLENFKSRAKASITFIKVTDEIQQSNSIDYDIYPNTNYYFILPVNSIKTDLIYSFVRFEEKDFNPTLYSNYIILPLLEPKLSIVQINNKKISDRELSYLLKTKKLVIPLKENEDKAKISLKFSRPSEFSSDRLYKIFITGTTNLDGDLDFECKKSQGKQIMGECPINVYGYVSYTWNGPTNSNYGSVKILRESPKVTYRFILSNTFLADEPTSFCDSKEELFKTYFPFLGVTILILILLIAAGYMAGSIFQIPAFLEWSKREIIELFLLGAFILFVPVLLDFNCSAGKISSGTLEWFLFESYFTQTEAIPILEFAQRRILDTIDLVSTSISLLRRDIAYLNIRATYYKFSTNAFLETIRSFAQYSSGVNENPLSADYTFLGVFNFLLSLENFYLFNILTHYFLLFFLSSSSGIFVFLFVFGLFFRCLPFLKNVGSALIAIGIGFYFIYPLGFVVIGLITHLDSPSFNNIFKTLIYSDGVRGFIELKPLFLSSISEVGGFTKDDFPEELNLSYLNPFFADCSNCDDRPYPPLFIKYFWLVSITFVLAVFLPAINLLITIAFIRDIALILGGDIDVSRLANLI